MTGMTLYLGIAGYFARPLFDDAERAARIAALIVDPRWPWPPSWCACGVVGSFTKRLRSQKIVGAKGEAWLRGQIADPEIRALELYRSNKEAENHSHGYVHTGTMVVSDRWEQPFDARATTRAYDLPDGRTIEAWIELMHELMVTLDVGCAIMPAWPTMSMVLSDESMGSAMIDSRWRGVIDLGPGPDFKLQNQRENYYRDLLGGTYVRAPRWGTYVRKAHVARLGGLDKIRAIEPAKLVELGELVFIQLTELADAVSAETEAKRRALAAVLGPLLAPARPSETAEQ